jgi:hypothetical protein
LGFLTADVFKSLDAKADSVVKQLQRLLQELDILLAREREAKKQSGKIRNRDAEPEARTQSQEPTSGVQTP